MVKYRGPNQNVLAHNPGDRKEYEKAPTFFNTWGMGYEGFTKPPHLMEMRHLTGSTGEFKWLAGFFLLVPIIVWGRRRNEDGLRRSLGVTTNRYAKMNLDDESSKICLTFPPPK